MLVDVRPGRPDHVYLSDFGLTKGAVSSASVTGTGVFVGTLDYCAPEQIRGQQVDARTDEYALACAVFTLMSGTPPFHRDDAMAVLYAQLSDPPPPLTSLRPDLPPAVDDVLQRALAKASSDRYASCGEFADALRTAFGLRRYDSDLAVALHQESLTDHQHQLDLDHAGKLAANASVAAAHQEARRSDEAVARRQQALTDQQQNLGPDHPDTLATRFSLARQMSARGEHTPGRRTDSGGCSRPGSGRWGRIIRTRWRPGSPSPSRWRPAGTIPGRRRNFGTCLPSRRGPWAGIIPTR